MVTFTTGCCKGGHVTTISNSDKSQMTYNNLYNDNWGFIDITRRNRMHIMRWETTKSILRNKRCRT